HAAGGGGVGRQVDPFGLADHDVFRDHPARFRAMMDRPEMVCASDTPMAEALGVSLAVESVMLVVLLMSRRYQRQRCHGSEQDRSTVSFPRFGQTTRACPVRPPSGEPSP